MSNTQLAVTMDSSETVDRLLQKAVAGDTAAMAQLLVFYSPKLRQRLDHRLRLNPFADFSAEDVMQETFVDVFRGIGTFQPEKGVPFSAWLNRVADNRLARFLRDRSRVKRGGRMSRARAADSSLIRLMDDLGDQDAATPSERIAANEARQAIELCVAALPEVQHDAVRRYYLDEQGLEEIAEAMGTTKEAVRSLLYRARQSMRSMMGASSKWFRKK